MDDGESKEEEAKRELREEIGIEAPLEFVMQMHHPGGADPDDEPDDLAIFKTRYDGPFTLDPKEVADIHFFPLKEIGEMAKKEPGKLHPEVVYFFTHHAANL